MITKHRGISIYRGTKKTTIATITIISITGILELLLLMFYLPARLAG